MVQSRSLTQAAAGVVDLHRKALHGRQRLHHFPQQRNPHEVNGIIVFKCIKIHLTMRAIFIIFSALETLPSVTFSNDSISALILLITCKISSHWYQAFVLKDQFWTLKH